MVQQPSPMIMTLRPDPLASKVGGVEGFSVARTALVGPDGPLMSLARLGRRLLLGICPQHASHQHWSPRKSEVLHTHYIYVTDYNDPQNRYNIGYPAA